MNVRVFALLSAILTAAALRLVPHPPNFTPIGAMALFSGAYLGRRGAVALIAPLAALLLSAGALVAMLRFKLGMGWTLVGSALLGALWLYRWN